MRDRHSAASLAAIQGHIQYLRRDDTYELRIIDSTRSGLLRAGRMRLAGILVRVAIGIGLAALAFAYVALSFRP